MAIRNDISIDWSQSPRIILVDAPAISITMQDLYDTLRDAEFQQMDEPSIVLGSGKEELGGGVLVGLTITLQNALLGFEARSGPEYTQCSITGGNLVAQDEAGVYFATPVYPTAFTQIVLANSSSATLQELTLIQQASFNGSVAVDVVNGEAGVEFPIGTPLRPVSNITDAYAISQSRGLRQFNIYGDITLSNEVNLSDYIFVGESRTKSKITINPEADTNGCEFWYAHILGTLDGDTILSQCTIDNLNYIEGSIENCSLESGTITIANDNTKQANFINCYSGVAGSGTPEIDCGGNGARLVFRGYDGGLLLKNKSGTAPFSIDFQAGQLVLENSVNAGEIVARGDAKVVNNVGMELVSGVYNGVTLINETGKLSVEERGHTADAVWNKELG